jgi:hypothetical protein
MRLLNIKLTKYVTITTSFFLFVVIFLSGCKKLDIFEDPKKELKTSMDGNSYYKTNENVAMFQSDKDGNPLTDMQIAKLRENNLSNINLLSTTCDDWDPGMATSIFKGHTANIICSQPLTDMVNITYSYELSTPSTPLVSSTSNKGRVRVSAAAWPTFSPAKTFTVPLDIVYLTGEDYYDPIFDVTMQKYIVTFIVSMTYSEFCSYNTYKSNFTIEYECENIGTSTAAYQVDAQNFTPEGYQPISYLADPLVGQIKFWPPIVLCTPQCHYPESGISTKHKIQYRLSGTTTWTTIILTNLNDYYVNVDPGTYEFRSAGVVNADPEEYGDFTQIQTVIVL